MGEFLKNEKGHVRGLVTVDAKITDKGIEAIPNSEREWPADLIILSMGFLHPEYTNIPKALSLETDQRNNILAEYGDYRTSVDGVFAAGDCRRGQSLVVWAINEGRGVADSVNEYLAQKNNTRKMKHTLYNINGLNPFLFVPLPFPFLSFSFLPFPFLSVFFFFTPLLSFPPPFLLFFEQLLIYLFHLFAHKEKIML